MLSPRRNWDSGAFFAAYCVFDAPYRWDRSVLSSIGGVRRLIAEGDVSLTRSLVNMA